MNNWETIGVLFLQILKTTKIDIIEMKEDARAGPSGISQSEGSFSVVPKDRQVDLWENKGIYVFPTVLKHDV